MRSKCTQQGGGDTLAGSGEHLAGHHILTAASHELPNTAGSQLNLLAGAAERLGKVGVLNTFGLLHGNHRIVPLGDGSSGHNRVGQVIGRAGTLQGSTRGNLAADGKDAVLTVDSSRGERVAVHLRVVEAGHVYARGNVLRKDSACRMIKRNGFRRADEDLSQEQGQVGAVFLGVGSSVELGSDHCGSYRATYGYKTVYGARGGG